jgi:ankyrin repeat protein
MTLHEILKSACAAIMALNTCVACGDTVNRQLFAAASSGDDTRIVELLRQGADVNARDARGRTAVMIATYERRASAVETLVRAGADINLRDDMLNNPFLYAGAEGMLDILKLANQAGADPAITNRYGGTALIPAAERGHVEVVRYLLERTPVDVNHVNRLGWTALLEAIVLSNGGRRHQQVVAELIRHHADVNLPDRQGRTPLRHARDRGYREIAALLEAAGARL